MATSSTPQITPDKPAKFWMVISAQKSSSASVKHADYETAHAEAERLCQKYLNDKFYVLETIEYHEVVDNPVRSITF